MLLLLPIVCTVLGGLVGYLLAPRLVRQGVLLGDRNLFLVYAFLVVAAVVANSEQSMYELGLSLALAGLVASAVMFVAFGTLVGAWRILYPARTRWFLLVPAAFLVVQPLLIMLMLGAWRVNGFAP
jgi:hypothetical protein